MAFKMKGMSFGNSPMKQKNSGKLSKEEVEAYRKKDREKIQKRKAKNKKWDIKGYLKGKQGLVPDYKGESTKKTVKRVKRKADIAADQIPYVGPSSSIRSTYAKAGGGSGIHYDKKATVNQPGYEKEKAQILKNKGWGKKKK